jgi:hypothetical protein
MATSGIPTDPATANSSSHVSTRPPSYGTVLLTLENVLLPPEKVDPSPSAADGLDEETETFLRVGGSELIQTSGILLKLPQVNNNVLGQIIITFSISMQNSRYQWQVRP